MMLRRRGNSVLTFPFVILAVLTIIITFTYFTVNMILPFIWYQKLQNTSNKYMYIIEKYGYLKDDEKNALIEDLERQGFDKTRINIVCPYTPQGYGTIIKFDVKYIYKQKIPSIEGNIKMITRDIELNVNKTIISKM